MAELVDALDSGSSQGNLVDVRVILAAIFSPLTISLPILFFSTSFIPPFAHLCAKTEINLLL